MTVVRQSGWFYRGLRTIGPLRALVRWGRALLGKFRVPAWYIEGRERASGESLALFYAGHLESRNHILHLAFEDGYTEQSAGAIWLWSAWRRGVGKGADLVVTRQDHRHLWLLGSTRGFNIPCWVALELDLALAEAISFRSSSVRSDLRKIRHQALGYEVSRDPVRFKWFYDTMYLPYVMRVHSDRAMPTPWSELESGLAECELLLLGRSEDPMAGIVLRAMGNGRARAWMIGLKQGDVAYAKTGALAAAYCFCIEHLVSRGYRSLHLGATRAFLHDGVLQFKKKYSPSLVGADNCVFHLRVARDSTGAGRFLTNNPFMTSEGGAFYGNVFVDDAAGIDREEIRKEISRNYVHGIAEQRVYALKDVVTRPNQGTWPPVPIVVEPGSALRKSAHGYAQ